MHGKEIWLKRPTNFPFHTIFMFKTDQFSLKTGIEIIEKNEGVGGGASKVPFPSLG